jgi:hypothetical protein
VKLLSLLEKLAPRIRLYPVWARWLFAATFALVLASVGAFALLSPSADRRLEETALVRGVSFDVGIVSVKAHRLSLAASELKTGESSFDAPLAYEAERVGAKLVATPALAYLELLERGGPLPPVSAYSWWDAAATYPALDVKVVNQTDRTVYVTSVDVVVTKSAADPRPVPVLHPGGDSLPRQFMLANEGAAMSGVTLRFDVERSGGEPRWREAYPHVVRIGKSRSLRAVSVEAALRDEGVDVAAIEALEAAALERGRGLMRLTAGERAALRRAAAPFDPSAPARLYGTLTYAFTSADGARKTRTVKFLSNVSLVQRRYGQGSAFRPTGHYNVRLRTAGKDYAQAVSGSRSSSDPETATGSRSPLRPTRRRGTSCVCAFGSTASIRSSRSRSTCTCSFRAAHRTTTIASRWSLSRPRACRCRLGDWADSWPAGARARSGHVPAF